MQKIYELNQTMKGKILVTGAIADKKRGVDQTAFDAVEQGSD